MQAKIKVLLGDSKHPLPGHPGFKRCVLGHARGLKGALPVGITDKLIEAGLPFFFYSIPPICFSVFGTGLGPTTPLLPTFRDLRDHYKREHRQFIQVPG